MNGHCLSTLRAGNEILMILGKESWVQNEICHMAFFGELMQPHFQLIMLFPSMNYSGDLKLISIFPSKYSWYFCYYIMWPSSGHCTIAILVFACHCKYNVVMKRNWCKILRFFSALYHQTLNLKKSLIDPQLSWPNLNTDRPESSGNITQGHNERDFFFFVSLSRCGAHTHIHTGSGTDETFPITTFFFSPA